MKLGNNFEGEIFFRKKRFFSKNEVERIVPPG